MTTMAYPLARTCRTCDGTIVYSGRGRPPTTCSSECRRKTKTDDRAAQRAMIAGLDEREDRFYALPGERADDGIATLTDYAPSFIEPGDEVDLGLSVVAFDRGGTRWASDEHGTPRHRDSAAKWLAANHPHELADFPRAI